MKLCKSLVIVAMLVLAGCSAGNTKQEPVSVLVPQGATALSMLPMFTDENNVKTVSGSDVVTAELSKADPEYDIIIAPINLGAKLMEKESSQYRMEAVITWGNLYVVGTGEEGTFAAFGENAVPGKILSETLPNVQATYFNAVQDVQAQLLSGNAVSGLLAEPAATATIAKAREKGITLEIQRDLQKEYQLKTVSGSQGYPQAAVFVKLGSEEKARTALKAVETFDNETSIESPDEIKKLIDDKNLTETLGVPNSDIAQKTWERQNIKYVKADSVKEDISTFLKLFQITFSEDMLTK